MAAPHARAAPDARRAACGVRHRAGAAGAGWPLGAAPPWQSVNDPAALGLIEVLVAKETPFLLWSVLALLGRPDVEPALRREIATVRSLGYGRTAAWWRVLWPQWLPRLALPVAAVLAYT